MSKESKYSGVMPLVTQSDPGTENFGVANSHTMLCQWAHYSIDGCFESLLDHGVKQDWYNSDNTLQVMIFRWVFILWLQRKLDSYQDRINHTAKRRDQNKSAEDFSALDFKSRRLLVIVFEQQTLNLGTLCLISCKGDKDLPLLQEHRDLPFHEETTGYYYMGGVHGGLGLNDGHHQLLYGLTQEDKPDVSHEADANVTGLDNAGLVVWEFSDEDEDMMYE
ncbi:hypothetical protein P692DRAFT_201810242 [Suillus brevipes Sb2]|nr:hypothetical protein P692DRAFT_201810242 [Suillus brevipes Sb2]